MIGMFLAAFTIGVVVAIPPGPVTISTGQRAIAHGFWNAFTFNLGSIVSDAFYALASFTVLSTLLSTSVIAQLALWILGGAWLCYMGIDAIRTRVDLNELDEEVERHTSWSNFRSGILITLFNPLTIAAWLALAGNFFAQWSAEWPPKDTFGLLAVLVMLLGTMAWVVVLAGVLSSIRRFVNARLVRWISVGSGLFLIVYGLSAWASALALILG
jgi:threonine/homoserine/homoserine lactone efflux protein